MPSVRANCLDPDTAGQLRIIQLTIRQQQRFTGSQLQESGELILQLSTPDGEAASLSYVPTLCQQPEINQIWGYKVTLVQGKPGWKAAANGDAR